jgi:hypothetical protein
MIMTGETAVLGVTHVQVTLCAHLISYKLAWDRARASVVTGRTLTASAMTRPNTVKPA